MKSALDELRAILERAEAEIRAVIGSEASAGRYEHIPELVKRAEQLRDGRLEKSNTQSQDASEENAPRNANGASSNSPTEDSTHRGKAGRYPIFFREGNRLVKVGWSKSTAAEYEHKTGKAVVDTLLAVLHERSANNRTFSVDEVSRAASEKTKLPLPSYQVYVSVAWLRSRGLLKRIGRDEYKISNRANFLEDSRKLWEGLPERSET